MRLIVNDLPTSMSASGTSVGSRYSDPGIGIAVRTRGRTTEHAVHRLLDRVAHDVLPLAGLVMGVGP